MSKKKYLVTVLARQDVYVEANTEDQARRRAYNAAFEQMGGHSHNKDVNGCKRVEDAFFDYAVSEADIVID